MPVRVDETRHDNHVLAVDFVAINRANIWSDRSDFLALDKHIGVEMLSDGRVHRQNNSVPDNCPLHLRFLFRDSFLRRLIHRLIYSADKNVFLILAFNSTGSER